MTVRDDVEYTFDDPDDGWFGGAAVMDPDLEPPHHADNGSAVVDHHATDADQIIADDSVDTDRWYMPVADPNAPEFVDGLHQEPVQQSAVQDPAATLDHLPARLAAPARKSWEARLSNSGAWDFKAPSAQVPWYRSKYTAVTAVLAAAIALVGIALLVRSPVPAVDDSPTVVPSDPSQPAPPSQAPALSSQAPVPVPPPGPPPPPPPSAEELSPPVVTRQYSPRYQTPEAPKKPQLNVTRAPMSATPPPPPKPDRNSATPGDASPRRRGFF